MTLTTKSTRENSGHYAEEICRSETANGCFRVIVCRNGIQWIIQRKARAAGGPHRAQWRAMSYLKTRDTLARLWAASTGENAPIQIQCLPARIMRRDQSNR
ncbi:MAG: hypothetical protein ACK4VZ_07465 [Paracoccaceae bacterium]